MRALSNFDHFCEILGEKIEPFSQTRIGSYLFAVILLGPLMFFPQVYEAWTAPNIDALRNPTWPLVCVMNAIGFLNVCIKGNWRVRIASFGYMCVMGMTWLATLIR
jgi:hypothetical protein